MAFVPDAPVNLQNDPSITSDSRIGFTWQDGASNGDKVVEDYRLLWDQSTGDWVTLVEGYTQ